MSGDLNVYDPRTSDKPVLIFNVCLLAFCLPPSPDNFTFRVALGPAEVYQRDYTLRRGFFEYVLGWNH